ncbi:cytochrome c-type biogenesis protein CcmE [Iodidimonas gelatinilytica]|uniref:Cytochrome c-type biogenesis protein CcmE n=1 Tax=Iodidimonas gelatinilytica TaxID=1236966 RepID=A0A5A7MNV8_9PROT|nr:cytochrome c maturation protein CcmE [Iodidimonas gelatinilytica]GEQ97702.1 cytochrome c-type biogenesis protein CcmE [Iodidimonas gelatinilytica]
MTALRGQKAWTRKRRRFWLTVLALLTLALAAFLIFRALDEQLLYFRLPSDVADEAPEPGRAFRLGGLVETDSLVKLPDGMSVRFSVSDGENALMVRYTGILPDLFREGQGIIADGRLDENGLFIADRVLAKHDETYMPKEVYDAIKERGHPDGTTPSGKTP